LSLRKVLEPREHKLLAMYRALRPESISP
jgi:predicted transcriptional regulator